MLCADMVDACWKDLSGRTRRATALLEDISGSGVCLQMESAVPLGTEIRLNCPKQKFNGFVRYCVYREIGYFIGVEFDASTTWSQKIFKPQHLLDLNQLMAQAKKA